MLKNRAILFLAIAQTLVWAGLYYLFPALLLRWEESFGWSKADLGIATASGQIGDVGVLRVSGDAAHTVDQLSFLFVLTGSCQITTAPHQMTALSTADCVTLPRGATFGLQDCSDDLQLLRVRLA